MKKLRRAVLTLSLLCVLAPVTSAQAPAPDEDIFLVDVQGANGKLTFGRPVNITARAGYDNQPAFLPDGRAILYTSQREGQTDIYRYDLRDRSTKQLTATPESEYSPTPTRDGRHFSVVRVEADKTQRLWQFPLAGGAPSLVLPDVKPIGYHLWLDARTLALFVLGEGGRPHTLRIVPLDMKFMDTVAVNVGRSLQLLPRREAFSFVHKLAPDDWHVKVFDLKTHKTSALTKTPSGSEDLAWTPDGAVLMAEGAKLLRFDPRRPAEGWQQVADFSAAGLQKITRLALSPKGDTLAFVAQR